MKLQLFSLLYCVSSKYIVSFKESASDFEIYKHTFNNDDNIFEIGAFRGMIVDDYSSFNMDIIEFIEQDFDMHISEVTWNQDRISHLNLNLDNFSFNPRQTDGHNVIY